MGLDMDEDTKRGKRGQALVANCQFELVFKDHVIVELGGSLFSALHDKDIHWLVAFQRKGKCLFTLRALVKLVVDPSKSF